VTSYSGSLFVNAGFLILDDNGVSGNMIGNAVNISLQENAAIAFNDTATSTQSYSGTFSYSERAVLPKFTNLATEN